MEHRAGTGHALATGAALSFPPIGQQMFGGGRGRTRWETAEPLRARAPARNEPCPCASSQFLLYCEGTRFTEQKHRVSMEVAVSKGLPVLKYHLLPRTKGFTTAVQCLRGTVAAVYDVTLNFRGNKNPSLLGILYGKKYEADMCVR
ncbi:1-acyl-sn-glycerol-3-phosphate acyltransferase gamma-like [Pteropus vampyrus]|uniref:1-acyl-sn-glycerol-3-phosphate acyltransferase gamma-like n=1 Tax=Pteropus vampyrus TaxID=132908 RepID=A0A6P3RZ51_PTEVA|nr:1-acyl-sn-glycerol-3-phosphate acyltransferase gamma-like [Pteropus vampyrus]